MNERSGERYALSAALADRRPVPCWCPTGSKTDRAIHCSRRRSSGRGGRLAQCLRAGCPLIATGTDSGYGLLRQHPLLRVLAEEVRISFFRERRTDGGHSVGFAWTRHPKCRWATMPNVPSDTETETCCKSNQRTTGSGRPGDASPCPLWQNDRS